MRHPRLSHMIVVTDAGLEVVPAVEVPRRVKLLTREHAERLLAKLTADTVEVTVREAFGPEVAR